MSGSRSRLGSRSRIVLASLYVEYNWRHEPYAEFVLYEDSGDHLYPFQGIK
jgi:hypothetical protein